MSSGAGAFWEWLHSVAVRGHRIGWMVTPGISIMTTSFHRRLTTRRSHIIHAWHQKPPSQRKSKMNANGTASHATVALHTSTPLHELQMTNAKPTCCPSYNRASAMLLSRGRRPPGQMAWEYEGQSAAGALPASRKGAGGDAENPCAIPPFANLLRAVSQHHPGPGGVVLGAQRRVVIVVVQGSARG